MTQPVEETLTMRVSYHGRVLENAASFLELRRMSCFVRHENPMPVATIVVVRFCTEDGRGMGPNLVSRVTHIEEISTRDKSGQPGMALNFEGLSEQEQDFIVHLCDGMALEEASAEFPDEPDPIPEPDIEIPDSPPEPEQEAAVQKPGNEPDDTHDDGQNEPHDDRDSVMVAGEIGMSAAGEIIVSPPQPEAPSVEPTGQQEPSDAEEPILLTVKAKSTDPDAGHLDEEQEPKPKKKRRRRKKKNGDQDGEDPSPPPQPADGPHDEAAPSQGEQTVVDSEPSPESDATASQDADDDDDEPKKKKRGRRRRKKKAK